MLYSLKGSTSRKSRESGIMAVKFTFCQKIEYFETVPVIQKIHQYYLI